MFVLERHFLLKPMSQQSLKCSFISHKYALVHIYQKATQACVCVCIVTCVSAASHAVLMVFKLSCNTTMRCQSSILPVDDVFDVVVDGLVVSSSVRLDVKSNLKTHI